MKSSIKKKIKLLRPNFEEYISQPTSVLLYFSTLMILIYLMLSHLFINSFTQHFSDLVLSSTTIIATIFAITISLTIIGFQYVMQDFSSKLLKYFFKSYFIIFMILIYTISILFNLIIIALGVKNIYLLNISISLFIISLLYSITYFYYIIKNMQEEGILYMISHNLSNQKYNDDLHEILKELTIKSIKNDNTNLYKNCINLLFKREILFLEKIKNINISKDYSYDSRHSEVEKIIYHFLNIQKEIFYNIIDYKRQIFLFRYIIWIENLQEIVFPLLSPRPYYKLRDHFNIIGEKIIENKFDEVYIFYGQNLRDITNFEYNKIPKEIITKYYLFNEDKGERDNEMILVHMMFDSFKKRLSQISELEKKCVGHNVKNFESFPKHILSNILMLVLEEKYNKKLRYMLITKIIWELQEIHKKYSEKKMFNRLLDMEVNWYINSIKSSEEVKEFGGYITREYLVSFLDVIKYNPHEVVRVLGYDGRVLKKKQENEIIIKLISEAFDKILKLLKEKKIQNVTKDYISNEIHSILGNIKENNKYIEKVIKKYKLKPSKNKYIMGVYMGLKEESKNKWN